MTTLQKLLVLHKAAASAKSRNSELPVIGVDSVYGHMGEAIALVKVYDGNSIPQV